MVLRSLKVKHIPFLLTGWTVTQCYKLDMIAVFVWSWTFALRLTSFSKLLTFFLQKLLQHSEPWSTFVYSCESWVSQWPSIQSTHTTHIHLNTQKCVNTLQRLQFKLFYGKNFQYQMSQMIRKQIIRKRHMCVWWRCLRGFTWKEEVLLGINNAVDESAPLLWIRLTVCHCAQPNLMEFTLSLKVHSHNCWLNSGRFIHFAKRFYWQAEIDQSYDNLGITYIYINFFRTSVISYWILSEIPKVCCR